MWHSSFEQLGFKLFMLDQSPITNDRNESYWPPSTYILIQDVTLFCPRYRFLRLELFKLQDKTVYSIPHCDRFVYLLNNNNVEIIKAVMDFLSSAYRNRALILRGQLSLHWSMHVNYLISQSFGILNTTSSFIVAVSNLP